MAQQLPPVSVVHARNIQPGPFPIVIEAVQEPHATAVAIVHRSSVRITTPEAEEGRKRGLPRKETASASMGVMGPNGGEIWHTHFSYYDIFFYIHSGKGTIWWKDEGNEHKADFGPGDFVHIAPNADQQWLNTGQEKLTIIQFAHFHNYQQEHLPKDMPPVRLVQPRDITLAPSGHAVDYIRQPYQTGVAIECPTTIHITTAEAKEGKQRGLPTIEMVRLGLMNIGPGGGEVWHIHLSYYDIFFYVKSGNGTIWWKDEGNEHKADFGPGDFVHIAPNAEQQWLNTGEENLELVAFAHFHNYERP